MIKTLILEIKKSHKNGKQAIFCQNSSLFSLKSDEQNWSITVQNLPNRVEPPFRGLVIL